MDARSPSGLFAHVLLLVLFAVALGRESRWLLEGSGAPRSERDGLGISWTRRGALPACTGDMSPRELRVLPRLGVRRAWDVFDAREARHRSGGRGALPWHSVRGLGPRTEAHVEAWLYAHGRCSRFCVTGCLPAP